MIGDKEGIRKGAPGEDGWQEKDARGYSECRKAAWFTSKFAYALSI
jgi:hypothetical protein